MKGLYKVCNHFNYVIIRFQRALFKEDEPAFETANNEYNQVTINQNICEH